MNTATKDFARAGVLVVLAVSQWVLAQNPDWLGLDHDIAQTSNAAQTPLIPPFWTVIVWNFLYAGSILFALWHLLSADRRGEGIRSADWFIAGSFAANCAWSVVYPIQGPALFSYALLVAGPVLSIAGLWRLNDARSATRRQSLPFAPIYALAGWQSVAGIAALSQVGLVAGLLPITTLSLVLLLFGASIILVLQRSLMSMFFIATVVWDFFGAAFENLTSDSVLIGLVAFASIPLAISYTSYLTGKEVARGAAYA